MNGGFGKVRGNALLVAPQGFTPAENKRDMVTVIWDIPTCIPVRSSSLSHFSKLALGFH